MDSRDKLRFVQRYVERQRAHVPAYAKEDPWSERHGTPSKPLRCDEFGFDTTPVLRPRVPVNKAPQSQLTQHAGPSRSQTKEADSGAAPNQRAPRAQASSEAQDPPLSSTDKPRPKQRKASTPIDTDSERAARLADRRERKRKKRAIVNPPQKHDEDGEATVAPKRGRKNDQKVNKSAALALMYGFSATNVTKDRLTLKPTPSLGVFSKGKASAKKKVTATNKPLSKNDIFSESAFLNKPSERAADHSRVDGDSDDTSVSAISKGLTPQVGRTTNHTKKGRGRCAKTKTTRASARTIAESEVWDVELQSKRPSARDALSEPGANDSALVVLDLRKAEWSASLEKPEARCNRAQPESLSVAGSPSLARPNPYDELDISHTVDEAPSIHPSHSASQVGRRAADTQPFDSRKTVTSKYFAEPVPVSTRQPSRSNDVLDFRIPDQDVQDAAMDGVTSLISVAQPMVEFGTRSDVVPLVFPSDCSPHDDCYARDLGRSPSAVESQGAEYYHPQQGARWSSYQPQWYLSDGFADDDVEHDFTPGFRGYDPLAPECEDDLGELDPAVELAEYDTGEAQPSYGSCLGETLGDFAEYEDEGENGSIWGDGESGGDMTQFLEGRALLLGVSEWPRRVELSGLAQAEMDVASRLRDHWRPLRLS